MEPILTSTDMKRSAPVASNRFFSESIFTHNLFIKINELQIQ